MRKVWQVFLRDCRRILRNPVAVVVTLGVAMLPSLYAWFNILANWDPYSATGNLQVAVANEDQGTTNDLVGHLDAGRQVVKKLKQNDELGWRFVDNEEQAVHGVETGGYYAAIVLPKDFGTVNVEPEPDASDAANTQFRNAVWGLYEAPAREKLWQGGFVNPVESYTTLVDYGQVRVVNGRQGSRSNSTKLYTIPGEPCRAPANGVVVLAAELALTGNTVVIDHGCGVVIGETAEVHSGTVIYQGVTLGGNGKEHGKRHPTIMENVTVSAGAKVLGGFVVGEGAKIGAGAVVLKEVPPHATVVGVPGRIVRIKGEKVCEPDLNQDKTDPYQNCLAEICHLRARVSELENTLKELQDGIPMAEVIMEEE